MSVNYWSICFSYKRALKRYRVIKQRRHYIRDDLSNQHDSEVTDAKQRGQNIPVQPQPHVYVYLRVCTHVRCSIPLLCVCAAVSKQVTGEMERVSDVMYAEMARIKTQVQQWGYSSISTEDIWGISLVHIEFHPLTIVSQMFVETKVKSSLFCVNLRPLTSSEARRRISLTLIEVETWWRMAVSYLLFLLLSDSCLSSERLVSVVVLCRRWRW